MEYIEYIFYLIIIFGGWLIYKKINKQDVKDYLDLERERKKDNESLKEKFTESISNLNTSLKTDITSIKERVTVVQSAQNKLDKLANEVIDFKNLFNNKTVRGRLGEEYLEDIVKDTMLKQHYEFQHSFANGKKVDCLLTIGLPEQSIPIDSKFSWENYKKMLEAKDENLRLKHGKEFSNDITTHIDKVSGYIIKGETAEFAFMFVASEGVFNAIVKSEIKDFIKQARTKGVIIVSPDTLFGHLRNYKLFIEKTEFSRLAKFVQKEVGMLLEDVKRLTDRFYDIGSKQGKVTEEFRKLNISVDKIVSRSETIKNLDFTDIETIAKK